MKEINGELEEPLRMLALAMENLLNVEAHLKEIEAKLLQLRTLPYESVNLANNHPLNGFTKVNSLMDIICTRTSTSIKERPDAS